MLDICSRIPNLKSISLADRPWDPYFANKVNRCGLGSENFKRETGINLRWTVPNTSVEASRKFVYDTTFALLRGLDRHMQLSIMLRGFRSTSSDEVQFLRAFDTNVRNRAVLRKHLVSF